MNGGSFFSIRWLGEKRWQYIPTSIFQLSDNNHVRFPHMIFSAISKNAINYKKPNLPYIGIIITILIIRIVSDYL